MSKSTQTMLYKRSEIANPGLGHRNLVYTIVNDDDISDFEAKGWNRSPDEAEAKKGKA